VNEKTLPPTFSRSTLVSVAKRSSFALKISHKKFIACIAQILVTFREQIMSCAFAVEI
jgi:hypothetical protein